jgi:hypothetical protein
MNLHSVDIYTLRKVTPCLFCCRFWCFSTLVKHNCLKSIETCIDIESPNLISFSFVGLE